MAEKTPAGGTVAGETVADLGEFGLIARVTRGRAQPAATLLGPGDDAAVVAAPDGRVVASTDVLVEHVHFRLDWSTPEEVGRKAAAVNLADIAAMGAVATALLVGLGCPKDTPTATAAGLAAGLWAEADRVGIGVVGGDVVSAPTVILSVTVLGSLAGRDAVTRSGARPGDVLALAGRLGWAAAGLDVLLAGAAEGPTPAGSGPTPAGNGPADHGPADDGPAGDGGAGGSAGGGSAGGGSAGGGSAGGGSAGSPGSGSAQVVDAHRVPDPPYSAGPAAARAGATAMIDISDGLLADVGHLAAASGVSVDVRSAALPVPDVLAEVGALLSVDPMRWLLTGGEDHALAATFPAGAVLPVGWTPIGLVDAGAGVSVDGVAYDGTVGWDHFG